MKKWEMKSGSWQWGWFLAITPIGPWSGYSWCLVDTLCRLADPSVCCCKWVAKGSQPLPQRTALSKSHQPEGYSPLTPIQEAQLTLKYEMTVLLPQINTNSVVQFMLKSLPPGQAKARFHLSLHPCLFLFLSSLLLRVLRQYVMHTWVLVLSPASKEAEPRYPFVHFLLYLTFSLLCVLLLLIAVSFFSFIFCFLLVYTNMGLYLFYLTCQENRK